MGSTSDDRGCVWCVPLDSVATLLFAAMREARGTRSAAMVDEAQEAALDVELFCDVVLGAYEHVRTGRLLPAAVIRALNEAQAVDRGSPFGAIVLCDRAQLACACLADYLRLRILSEGAREPN